MKGYNTEVFNGTHLKIFNKTRQSTVKSKDRQFLLLKMYEQLGNLLVTFQSVELTFQSLLDLYDILQKNEEEVTKEISKMTPDEINNRIDDSVATKDRSELKEQFKSIKKIVELDKNIIDGFNEARNLRNEFVQSYFVVNEVNDFTIPMIRKTIISMTYHLLFAKQVSIDVSRIFNEKYVKSNDVLMDLLKQIESRKNMIEDYKVT